MIITTTQTGLIITESQVTGLTADLAARLIAANNLSDLTNKPLALNNLGLPTLTNGQVWIGSTGFNPVNATLTAGTEGVVRLTAYRGFHVNLRDSSGNEKLGSSLSAAYIPVVIASDQVAIPTSQSGTWNLNNISGTISLPTGAATSANQVTEITSLQSIDNPVGSVVPGTAGTSSFLMGAIYNSTPPTVTNGQQVAIQVDSSGRLLTTSNISEAMNGGGVNGALTVNTTVVEAKVGASSLTGRALLSIFHNGPGNLYWGMSNAVTTANGTRIFKNTSISIPVGANSHVWLISDTTGQDVRIVEIAQ
jgi:hypothetical protein